MNSGVVRVGGGLSFVGPFYVTLVFIQYFVVSSSTTYSYFVVSSSTFNILVESWKGNLEFAVINITENEDGAPGVRRSLLTIIRQLAADN